MTNAFQFFITVNIGQIDGNQIANVNQTVISFGNNLTVFNSLFSELGRADVTVRFRAEVGADDDAVVLVGVISVQRVFESNVGHAGFNLRLHQAFQKLFGRHKLEHFQLAELGVKI